MSILRPIAQTGASTQNPGVINSASALRGSAFGNSWFAPQAVNTAGGNIAHVAPPVLQQQMPAVASNHAPALRPRTTAPSTANAAPVVASPTATVPQSTFTSPTLWDAQVATPVSPVLQQQPTTLWDAQPELAPAAQADTATAPASVAPVTWQERLAQAIALNPALAAQQQTEAASVQQPVSTLWDTPVAPSSTQPSPTVIGAPPPAIPSTQLPNAAGQTGPVAMQTVGVPTAPAPATAAPAPATTTTAPAPVPPAAPLPVDPLASDKPYAGSPTTTVKYAQY